MKFTLSHYTFFFAFLVAGSAAENCTICQDGSAPPNPQLIIFPGKRDVITCQDYDDKARQVSVETGCGMEHFNGHLCGCKGNTPPEDGCSFCEVDLPDPYVISNPEIESFGGLYICGIEVLRSKYVDKQGEMWCEPHKSMTARLCGCAGPDSPEIACNICPEGQMANSFTVFRPPSPFLDPPPTSTCYNTQYFWDLAARRGETAWGSPFNDTTCQDNKNWVDGNEDWVAGDNCCAPIGKAANRVDSHPATIDGWEKYTLISGKPQALPAEKPTEEKPTEEKPTEAPSAAAVRSLGAIGALALGVLFL